MIVLRKEEVSLPAKMMCHSHSWMKKGIKKIKWVIAKSIKNITHPAALNKCVIDKTADISAMSDLTCCTIGRYSYVGYNTFAVNAEIGSFCSIANGCVIGGAAHSISHVSTSPLFNSDKNVFRKDFADFPSEKTERVVIGHDVWLGHGVFIKSGVHIATGAIIGMGAVVTKDVGPYEIWAGNPAKKIRNRFDDPIKERLLSTEWWLWEEERIKRYAVVFDDPLRFIDLYEKETM